MQVAGGIAAGTGVLETLVKECKEEASIGADLVSFARAMGTIRCVKRFAVSALSSDNQ